MILSLAQGPLRLEELFTPVFPFQEEPCERMSALSISVIEKASIFAHYLFSGIEVDRIGAATYAAERPSHDHVGASVPSATMSVLMAAAAEDKCRKRCTR